MIAHLSGRLLEKSADSIVVDVGGVGYEVLVPMSTFCKLPEVDQKVALRVHTCVKDDAIDLYGFATQEEKEAFTLLISVTGIGPKLARNILSGVEVADLVQHIGSSDKARLSRIPGIGIKTSERMILELKDKVRSISIPASQAGAQNIAPGTVADDVLSALSNLGYKAQQAEPAVKSAIDALGDDAAFEAVFKEALRKMARK